MKALKTRIYLLFAIALFPALLTYSPAVAQSSQDFEISKNLDIFMTLYKQINTNYVDDVQPAQLIRTGIDAMLESLDPYTVYIPEAEIEDYRFMTTGEYGGIGSLIHKQGDYIIVSEPYEKAPAQKAGLKAGDRILKVNDKSTAGKSVDDVSSVLKGQPGSTVKLLIERPGEPKPFTVEIPREKISIDPVPYYGLLNGSTGYIKLNSFTQTASADVRNAFSELKKNGSLTSLVLDLRDNGGGLLNEAVSIVNLFVKRGEVVVSTKGKQMDKNKTYKTLTDPVDPDIPLVILVNGSSASASEIVAGALQDLDRAVIVGRRTFGKGLVQNIYPLSYNTQAKITVAKYYIPSGRCIQAIDYTHKDGNGEAGKIPDSLITAFKTQHGRTVYDGKGVSPDISSDSLRFSSLAYNLVAGYFIFDYATQYCREHPAIPAADSFHITDPEYDTFVTTVNSKGFEFATEVEKVMKDIKKAATVEQCWDDIKPAFEAMESALRKHKSEDFTQNKTEITKLLELEIVSRYYYQKGRIQASLTGDPDIGRALEVLGNMKTYSAILDGSFFKDGKSSSGKKI